MTRLVKAMAVALGVVALAPPAAALSTIEAAQGGVIVYGAVKGATTQPGAMAEILRNVHQGCKEKPALGRVFRYRDTDLVGVFFTVTNHPGGDKRVAGLVLAAPAGGGKVEGALVSDAAERFGKSVNPMLNQLFAAWHPAGAVPARALAGAGAPAGAAAPAEPLRPVTLPDRSAQLGLPQGWSVNLQTSGGGSANVKGPHREVIHLNASFAAHDPRDPGVRMAMMQRRRMGQPDPSVYLPYGVNPTQAFLAHYAAAQRRSGFPQTRFQVAHSGQVPGKPCVSLEGTAANAPIFGEPVQFFGVFCEEPPKGGMWLSSLYMAFLPNSVAARERATALAVMRSYRVDMRVVNSEAAAIAAPAIAQIEEVGRRSREFAAANQGANDAQHAQYWAKQDADARRSKERSDFMLDQTVVQDNNAWGTGTAGHATVWNGTAEALVKADPGRFELVDRPNYWQGTDY